MKATGYDGFETNFRSLEHSFDNPAPMRREIEARGVPLIGMHMGASLFDAAKVAEERAQILRVAKAVKRALGGGHVIVSGRQLPVGRDGHAEQAAIEAKAREAESLGKQTRAMGVRLSIHNHTHEVANDGAEIRRFLELTTNENVGLLFDVGHVLHEEMDVARFVRENGKRITGLHVRDVKGGEEVLIGTGVVDFKGIGKAIRDTGWAGWVIVEVNPREDVPSRDLVERRAGTCARRWEFRDMDLSRRTLVTGGLAAFSAAQLAAQQSSPSWASSASATALSATSERSKSSPASKSRLLCDLMPERMAAAKNGPAANAQTYVDYRELVRDKNVQAVVIVAPNYLHAEMAIAALKAGKDVLMEKPIGLNWAEAKRVAEAAKQSGRILAVGMQRHYANDYAAIREFINGGGIGKLNLATLSEYCGDWNPKTTKVDGKVWRYQRKYAGSSLLEFSVHSYGFLYEMIEAPLVECSATGGAVHWPERTTEDIIAVIGKYANGVRVSHSYCGYAPGVPWRLTLVGSKGTLDYDRKTATVRVEGQEALRARPQIGQHRFERRGDVPRLLRGVRTRRPPPLNPDFALEATKLAYAAWMSIDQGASSPTRISRSRCSTAALSWPRSLLRRPPRSLAAAQVRPPRREPQDGGRFRRRACRRAGPWTQRHRVANRAGRPEPVGPRRRPALQARGLPLGIAFPSISGIWGKGVSIRNSPVAGVQLLQSIRAAEILGSTVILVAFFRDNCPAMDDESQYGPVVELLQQARRSRATRASS
ncbi:MAG: TIM barrel protein [Bryobacterales bacterium]